MLTFLRRTALATARGPNHVIVPCLLCASLILNRHLLSPLIVSRPAQHRDGAEGVSEKGCASCNRR